MKWQKRFLVLAVSGAALGCVALVWLTSTSPEPLVGRWQRIIPSLFGNGMEPSLPAGTLDAATWWLVCAVLVVDVLYVVWRRYRGNRLFRIDDNERLAMRHCLSTHDYEVLLRQRYDDLLARYQDPRLVQFLLNREAARAQRITQWLEVSEAGTQAKPTTPKNRVRETSQCTEGPTFIMMINPIGA